MPLSPFSRKLLGPSRPPCPLGLTSFGRIRLGKIARKEVMGATTLAA